MTQEEWEKLADIEAERSRMSKVTLDPEPLQIPIATVHGPRLVISIG